MDYLPLVNIVMVTFNHEKYIAQAIESVLMQITDFPYQLIIGDDCSNDSTNDICQKFAAIHQDKILLIRNPVNIGLVKNYYEVFRKCTAKYIAILEGDDYWIDRKKLQKQVDILESRHEVGLIHSSTFRLFDNAPDLIPFKKSFVKENIKRQGFIYNELIKENFIYALTVMFRKELFDLHINYKFLIENNVKTVDHAIWLGISLNSQIAYIKDYMCVYRIRSNSVSHNLSVRSQQDFFTTTKLVTDYYLKLVPTNNFNCEAIDYQMSETFLLYWLLNGDYESASNYFSTLNTNTNKLRVKSFLVRNKLTFLFYSKFVKIKRHLKIFRI